MPRLYFRLQTGDPAAFTDPTGNTVTLRDPTQTFGVRDADTEVVVVGLVPLRTYTRQSAGIYFYDVPDEGRDLEYGAEFVNPATGETESVLLSADAPPTTAAAGRVLSAILIIRRGDSYGPNSGQQRVVDKADYPNALWPDLLDGWALELHAKKEDENLNPGTTVLGPVVCLAFSPTAFRPDLTVSQTTTLAEGKWRWLVKASKGVEVNTLVGGVMYVQRELPVDAVA